ncbi:hypothetical protein JOD45_000848 [Scopulibacillus daqui]|uniref:YtkA-like protein n=1 Tax=Scopulibacillus daqui TaxID=1469162 RepID=A0ABS2PYL1_9BACL|nr:hypothetical protein [Scopulibacillus daqui]MBM7644655.1 hypothetical protein [Scopulibacillus daqui]
MAKQTIWRVLFIFSVCSFLVASQASAQDNHHQSGLMITSLTNDKEPIANKKIPFTVHVSSINEKDPEQSIKDDNHVVVYAFFKKGNEIIKRKLTNDQKGNYKGTVTLPWDGKWQVMAFALTKDQGNIQPESMKTEWKVEKPRSIQSIIWPIVLAVIIILAIGYFIFNRLRLKRNDH